HERQSLIDDIETAAHDGIPAPGTLHGDRVFSVHLLPGSAADSTGYLLKITAGAEPGALVCRHIHYPQDWCWPRVLETTHRLTPEALYVGPQPLPAPSRPLMHVIARDASSGVWQIAVSNGRGFQPSSLTYWSPHEWSVLVSGDFTGDRLTDLLGRSTDGSWWL